MKITYLKCKECGQLHYKVTLNWAKKDSKLTGVNLSHYENCDECGSNSFFYPSNAIITSWRGESIPPVVA